MLYPKTSQMVLCPYDRKISYGSQRNAEAAAIAGRSNPTMTRRDPEGRYKIQAAYDCDHCDYWHLTTSIGLVAEPGEREVWSALMDSVRYLVSQMRRETMGGGNLAEALYSLERRAKDFRMKGHPNADEGLASPRRNIAQVALVHAGNETLARASEIAAEALHDRYFSSDEWAWVTTARERLVSAITEACGDGEVSVTLLLEYEQAYLSSLRNYMSKEFTDAALASVAEEEYERVLMATEECVEACENQEVLVAVNEVLFGIEEISQQRVA